MIDSLSDAIDHLNIGITNDYNARADEISVFTAIADCV